MHLVPFDVDGALVESYDFDPQCYMAAIQDVLVVAAEPDWSRYQNVTDSGIFAEVIEGAGLDTERERFSAEVRGRFVIRIADHIARSGISPIAGAGELLSHYQPAVD